MPTRRRPSPRLLAAVAATLAARAAHADPTVYVGPSSGNWNSAGSPTPNWVDQTTNVPLNAPLPLTDVLVGQSATGDGATGSIVQFNVAVPAPGYNSLTIDSANRVTQTSGTTVLLVSGLTAIGSGSSGGAYVQSAGLNQSATLQLGAAANGVGAYTLSGGTVIATAGEFVGYAGLGTYAQSGGSNRAASLSVGTLAGATGAASLTVGALRVDGTLTIGDAGTGTVNYAGGTLTAAALRLGNAATGVGTLSLTNNVALNVASQLIGAGGAGTYNQDGAASNTATAFTLGLGASGSGTANITGGTLTVSPGGTAAIGAGGTGRFFHTGGTVRTPTLLLGTTDGATASSFGFYSMSNNAVLQVTGNASVGDTGFGIFNQAGGSTTIAGTLTVGASGSNNAFVIVTAGSLAAAATANAGVIQHAAGVASLGPLTGSASGRLFVGAASGATALATVTSLQQSAVTVNATGTLRLATNPTRLASTIGALSLAGSGTLDLGNGVLQLDNAKTPTAAVVAALKQAYNFNAQTKFGRWDGPGGLTSSDAVASVTAGTGNVTVAYVDGSIQNKYPGLDLHNTLGGPTLATNRTLVRAALMGDVNLDGRVNGDDISVIAQFGRYNKTAPDGWVNGDLNYDGLVNGDDISLIAQTKTYNASTVYGDAAASPAPAAASADLAAASTIGVSGDKVFDYVYDRSTGSLSIQYDGDANINGDTPLATLKVLSAAGRINVTVANQNRPSGVTRPFTTTANEITWTFFEPADGTFPDGYSFGAILPAGLTAAQVLSDLDLSYARSGALGYTTADLVVVPEPTTLAPLALAAATLLARRRRRRQGQLR